MSQMHILMWGEEERSNYTAHTTEQIHTYSHMHANDNAADDIDDIMSI